MYTRKRRSFKVTPGKLEELQERLVEMRGTPAKGGETPEKRGEPCFARLGIILYGLKPSYSNVLPIEIKPVLEWKSVISMIKTVHPGETIGYGRTYKVKENMQVATIPTGYADGYNRLLSNRGYVLLHGKRAPIVGRICMDQFMIDVTNISEARPYDEVILIGKSGNEILTADDMAEMLETIGYEVVCDISKRVPRLYINETSS